jgi:hypothetical protein
VLNQVPSMLGDNVLSGLGFDILDESLQVIDRHVCLPTIKGSLGSVELGKQAFGYTGIVDMSGSGSMNHTVTQRLHRGFVKASMFVVS